MSKAESDAASYLEQVARYIVCFSICCMIMHNVYRVDSFTYLVDIIVLEES